MAVAVVAPDRAAGLRLPLRAVVVLAAVAGLLDRLRVLPRVAAVARPLRVAAVDLGRLRPLLPGVVEGVRAAAAVVVVRDLDPALDLEEAAVLAQVPAALPVPRQHRDRAKARAIACSWAPQPA